MKELLRWAQDVGVGASKTPCVVKLVFSQLRRIVEAVPGQ